MTKLMSEVRAEFKNLPNQHSLSKKDVKAVMESLTLASVGYKELKKMRFLLPALPNLFVIKSPHK